MFLSCLQTFFFSGAAAVLADDSIVDSTAGVSWFDAQATSHMATIAMTIVFFKKLFLNFTAKKIQTE